MSDGRIIVIGGGAAGAWAALAARRAGASVALVRRSPGASAVSSGALDLGAASDLSGRPARPEEAAFVLARSRSDHPYAALGASLSDVIARARGFLVETHTRLGLTGAPDRNLKLATPLGAVKESWLAQGSVARGDLQAWAGATIGVVDLPNRTAFDGRAMAAGLTAAGYRAIALPVSLPIHAFASTQELARLLDEGEPRQAFAKAVALAAKSAGATHVLLPTAGLIDPTGMLDAIVRDGVSAAAEIIGAPPSVPGLRLEMDLQACLRDAGIEIVTASVREGVRAGGRIQRLQLDDGRELEADAFVLATGRFLGGGIRHEGVFHETVFGLPVFVDKEDVADKWLGDLLDRNAAGTQSALKAGVAVDTSMRPVDDQGHVVLENLFAAGSVIGGYDPAKDGSGLGVAALTALAAGEGAARWVNEQDGRNDGTSRNIARTTAGESRP